MSDAQPQLTSLQYDLPECFYCSSQPGKARNMNKAEYAPFKTFNIVEECLDVCLEDQLSFINSQEDCS